MKKILVADDRPDIVLAVQRMLQPYCEVDTATTGIEVLKMFKKTEYSGLIIDVTFADGMSGLEIASKLRAKHENLVILVFSATSRSAEIQQQVKDIGGVFRTKPLLRDDVRDIMEV